MQPNFKKISAKIENSQNLKYLHGKKQFIAYYLRFYKFSVLAEKNLKLGCVFVIFDALSDRVFFSVRYGFRFVMVLAGKLEKNIKFFKVDKNRQKSSGK